MNIKKKKKKQAAFSWKIASKLCARTTHKCQQTQKTDAEERERLANVIKLEGYRLGACEREEGCGGSHGWR